MSEELDIRKKFDNNTDITRSIKELFGPEKMWFNSANGINIANQILSTARVFDEKHGPIFNYSLTAPMQCGKTQAINTAIAHIFKTRKQNINLVYYISNANNGLQVKTINEIANFWLELQKYDNSWEIYNNGDGKIDVVYKDQWKLEIRVIHNGNAKRIKDSIADEIKANKEQAIQIIIYDEADQAYGKESQRDKFSQRILQREHAYDKQSFYQRQLLNMLEISISATDFANKLDFENTTIKEYTNFLNFEVHPAYYGLDRIHDEGYYNESWGLIEKSNFVQEKVDKFVTKVINPFLNGTHREQNTRPLGMMRVKRGNKNKFRFVDALKNSTNLNTKVASANNIQEFNKLVHDDKTKLIILSYNGKDFSRSDVEQIIQTFRKATKPAFKSKFYNFNKHQKKVIITVDGVMKAGDDLIGKSLEFVAFWWERSLSQNSTFEAPLQSLGRVCKISYNKILPPIVYSDLRLPNIIKQYTTGEKTAHEIPNRNIGKVKENKKNTNSFVFYYDSEDAEQAKTKMEKIASFFNEHIPNLFHLCGKPRFYYGDNWPDEHKVWKGKSFKHNQSYQENVSPTVNTICDKRDFVLKNNIFPPNLVQDGFGQLHKNKANTRIYAKKIGNIYRCAYVSTFLETEKVICDSFEKFSKRPSATNTVYIKTKPEQYKPKRETQVNKEAS
ncbi:MAG: hypothetical protein GOVbin1807_47 [Prokaryotic dsDNA virus sp.]|nr:MAG: hypothetical protein GOVbin1807_47 [Prokaryotic dsDNA virus sp.]|tara:strand:+ start:7047 stop:9065 length:2019 start_codon:yes stop_codon:yes gene_type:complete